MGLILVSGPSAEPVTLAEAKAHCRIAIADDDGLLAGYILAARIHLENEARRAFVTQTFDATFDYQWPRVWDSSRTGYRNQITMLRAPLQSVASITYLNEAGVLQTLATDQYVISVSGIEGIIEPAYNVTWPSVREQKDTITVRFTCGYAQVPDPIRQAILLLVGHWYENRETVVIGTAVIEMPLAVERLMAPYRVFY